MSYLLLSVNLLMKFLQTLFNKKTSNLLSARAAYLWYGAFCYALSAVLALGLVFLLHDGSRAVTAATFLPALLGAVALALSLVCTLAAMKSGAVVLCTLAGAAGLLIPTIAGIFWFHEPLSLWQMAGIVLFFASAYLLTGYSKKLYTTFSFKTVILLVLSMLSNGAVMLAQKLFAQKADGASVSMFSFLMFGLTAAFYLVCAMVFSLTHKTKPEPDGAEEVADAKESAGWLSPQLLGYGAVLSVSLLVINQLSTVLAGKLPSVVLFSVNDGGGMIIAAVTAAIFFREKLTLRSGIGIAVGLGALFLIGGMT